MKLLQRVIEILNNNKDKMKIFQQRNLIILNKYDPRKNENKMIYGKLVEKNLIETFDDIFVKCSELDINKKTSNYKNDCCLNIDGNELNFSIKAKKNKTGNIILINKYHSKEHNLENLITIVITILDKKIYFIPHNEISEEYVQENPGCILYKSKILTFMKKNKSKYIYDIPNLGEINEKKINDYFIDNNESPINLFYKEIKDISNNLNKI